MMKYKCWHKLSLYNQFNPIFLSKLKEWYEWISQIEICFYQKQRWNCKSFFCEICNKVWKKKNNMKILEKKHK